MRKIVIGFDEASLKNAISELKRYERDLRDAVQRGAVRAAEAAAEQANTVYASFGDGQSATAYVDPTETGANVQAVSSGNIAFVEFGAGFSTTPSQYYANVGFPVAMGSWSDDVNGMYKSTNYEYWVHNGQTYSHVEPAPGMSVASEYTRQYLNDYIRTEVESL